MTPATHKIARYGWVRDLPDIRDLHYASHRMMVEAPPALPPHADLSAQCPAPYDQGQLGSCTANAIGGAFEFDQIAQGLASWTPSRLFIYYNERKIEGHIQTDSGAQIRDGIKVVAKTGAPPETIWPYNIARFRAKPSPAAYKAARANTATSYFRIDNTDITQLKSCLAAGYPFVFGITVYGSFESQAVAANGIVPMPLPSEQTIGGHAILGVGYDDATQRFKFRNSWGSAWGDGGYGYLPYAYVTSGSLASDFWTIRSVT